MKAFSRAWFPVAVAAATMAGVLGIGQTPVNQRSVGVSAPRDTVIHVKDAYKLNRKGDLGEIRIADSLLNLSFGTGAGQDTVPQITARDTMKVPDSLRFTDPFRYKYYVALVDSLTHVIVRDSLKHTSDSLRIWSDTLRARGDLPGAAGDSLRARMDSLDWRKIDSIYVADSAFAANAKFLAWYNSLSRKERRKYDMEQMLPIKMHEMDSIRRAKEDAKARKDSIIGATPRVLQTYALPESLFCKRMVTWTVEPEFHKVRPQKYDTTYNYRFYDYPWQHNDVNANWLGVAGSPVQYYNVLNRQSREGVDFYAAYEPWSFDPGNIRHFNTKVPYTELCYFGTILAADAKESDNLHLFTTQNILPELNFSLLFDRFGGGGILENEETKNKNTAVDVNYIGKKYMAHAGYIGNNAYRKENGGVADVTWIRDTTVEAREIPVNLKDASSSTKKKTFYLQQQLRIPFNFVNNARARIDTTFKFDPDSMDLSVTTAFIGHSTEWSRYSRLYEDKVNTPAAKAFYNNVNRFGPNSRDTLGVTKLDNKLFLRLQPFANDAFVSKLDVGIGDLMMQYFDSTSVRPTKHTENSVYLYAGAEGQIRDGFHWDAGGDYFLAGSNSGDFGLHANAELNIYPFRRAKTSPLSLRGHFETTLREPNYYQRYMNVNHFSWENELDKVSTTRLEGTLDIPHWALYARVGYSLFAGNVYYDTLGIARQSAKATSVLSASLRKDLVLGPLHMENQALLQFSSDQEVIPVPTAAFNLRWYFQFVLQRDETKTQKILEMQIGANAFYNTPWFSPTWNPNVGVFYNQNKLSYTNGPFFDLFVNVQWKRACIFIKYQNAGGGWPMKKFDYFSSDRYVVTEAGSNGLKLGLYWPFYTQPATRGGHDH